MGKYFLKNGLGYTKKTLLQIQVCVNLIIFLEVYYSFEEEEYAQIDKEHIDLHKSLWDHVKKMR